MSDFCLTTISPSEVGGGRAEPFRRTLGSGLTPLASLVCVLLLGWTQPLAANKEVSLLPSQFALHGQQSIQQLAVVQHSGTNQGGDATNQMGPQLQSDQYELRSTDPSVVRIIGQRAESVANGKATIEVVSNEQVIASSRVTVAGAHSPRQWSFRNDVQSVLAKQGCNMGSCHGALAGKGGFRLSLHGYDSKSDFFAIAREVRGRRIEIADPGRSLLIAKPTGALPHKGGLRLDVDSRDYQVLSRWIASGAKAPQENDPRLEQITVTPEFSRLTLGDQTRVLVSAHYDDGRILDVTHWSKFSATDESVASVSEDGIVTVRGSGEGAVLVWFGSQVKLAHMTVPYPNQTSAEAFASSPRRNFIDELNLQQLQSLQLPPSPRCDDDAFLRRVTIDTIGRLPTIGERVAFLASVESDSSSQPSGTSQFARDEVIDRLLASEDFVDYWTYRFSDLLLISGNQLRPAAVEAFYMWLRDKVAVGTPWDELVRQILTSKGISTENGATNFFALHQSPEDMTENACQAFMGLSIGCAKCHNHPLEKWTNDQYYSMANLFSRVRAKGWGGDSRNGDGVRTLYVADSGELIQPSTGKPQPPAPLDESPLAFNDPSDRRVVLAEWMTASDNPYFARSITNRIWANYFGKGLVMAVDDLRLSNPASNEALMSAAAEHLVDVGFDLRSLMRTILQSETYQRSSLPLPENASESKYLSRYYPRRLMAEVLLDSIDQTLSTATSFDKIALTGSGTADTKFYPVGTRALELYDSAVKSYFLKAFGRNPREITCDCERSEEPSMVQVLHLSNGTTLNPKLSSEDCVISRGVAGGESDEAIITDLFHRALSRDPLPTEIETILSVIREYPPAEHEAALQDAAWSILTSTEFTFNH